MTENNPADTVEDYLRVSATSTPQSVASAISHAVQDAKVVKVRCVGAGAVNQAVKAIAIARGYVAPRGVDLSCKPGFMNIESRDGQISAVVFHIEAR